MTDSAIPQEREVEQALARALGGVDVERARREYWDQNECLFLERFLPPEVVERHLLPEVDKLRPNVHRNYIPGHKKGGAISYYTLSEKAPLFLALYKSPAFIDFVSRLTGARARPCPDADPHACALYFYTEPGDHMGFHYDNSYYRGDRYTILLGLVQRTEHCRLVARLYRDDPTRETREVQLAYGPGALVIFNGPKLYHAVTPLAEGEERIVLTMEYVTNPEMGVLNRVLSNMKDAFAYFGVRALIRRNPRSEKEAPS
ncbi:MAG: 2OG-Fe(II) oxygenase [Candidatus Rokuibacteriota bacterium]